MIYTNLTKKAMLIAFEAHKNQTDKSGFPYIHHPLHLAEQLNTENEVITALLHDVVEDTDWTFEALEQEGFPQSVISALRLLTHEEGVEYLEYVKQIKANPLALTIKLADLRHNSDPARLAALPPEKAERLRQKYAAAIELLEQPECDTGIDLDLTSRLTTKYYVAYGSNMNARIMYRRCKRAKKIGTTYIEDWKLTMPFYADIEPSVGDRAPALVWEIDLDDEACLDMCEGVPTLYTKSELTVEVNGKTLTGLVYIMTDEYKNSGRKPKDGYVESIVQGYEDCGFCTESLKKFVK